MIIIHPFSSKLRNGKRNPKDYPYWKELIAKLEETDLVVQVGIEGEEELTIDFRKNLSIPELEDLIRQCRTWIAVDSFFQHLAWSVGKPGIVLWGIGDPKIFWHPENQNLLKDEKNIRPNVFDIYENETYREDVFVSPDEVLRLLR